jgi:glycogen debranching enzyme
VPDAPSRPLQPLLHDLVSTVMAPTTALGGADGQIRAAGVQGLFHADSRVLSQATLAIDGREPEPIGHAPGTAGRTRFVSVVRWLGDPIADPTVRVDRTRQIAPGRLTETVEIASTASHSLTFTLTIALSCDFAPMDRVKSGTPTHPPSTPAKTPSSPPEKTSPSTPGKTPPSTPEDRPSPERTPAHGGGVLEWTSGRTRVTVTAEGAAVQVTRDGGLLSWEISLAPRERATLSWSVTVDDPEAVVTAPTRPLEWSVPRVTADDTRLVRLAARSLDDLRSLRLAESTAPDETFLAAGVPWFLTLFGRDSLWAARMLLPLGTGLAASTLRVLAARRGTRTDPATGEAPGKIMHELRRHEHTGRRLRLPAAYYGTIDATPLWISLLHDAWRWGMPESEVEQLLPALEAALGWLGEHADPDGDGFLEYIDVTGHGLANQGWKDSGDAVRFRDGTQAEPPIALAEVQGYACAAARHGAALLEAFGRGGADRWTGYAEAMADRFRDRFWTDGGYPALALDRDKRRVDSLTSNIGHLIGTGLLSPVEEAKVAEVLAGPDMSGGFGLRTMSATDAAFSPLSYHCGSVWSHDTAIVLAALARAGHADPAAELAAGLLAAGEAFGYRLPELHAGDDREPLGRPIAYPAACRPQAWSAAAAVTLLHAAVGLYPDVPGGKVLLRPLAGAPLGAVGVRGLRVAGAEVTVTVDRSGAAQVTGLPPGLRVESADPPC